MELQREVLPKVLCSVPCVNPTDDSRSCLPFVQFLNSDASHAVRLFTPPFHQGPVETPITVFLVGIATEDGCFFSGLRRKFEVGHLYPENQSFDRSAICICTATYDDRAGEDTDTLETGTRPIPMAEDESSSDRTDYNSDDSVERNCACLFRNLNDGDRSVDSEEGRPYVKCNGGFGPGRWHCYTVVVDGGDSRIRVDGTEEETTMRSVSSTTSALLDGLTIGSDHGFDMTLCLGQGSDGEGQGAIAELAVFKGRLPTIDLKEIECSLMTKHGLSSSNPSRATEDMHSRIAHQLLSVRADVSMLSDGKLTSLPLRCLSRHHTVAWTKVNPVTGERRLYNELAPSL